MATANLSEMVTRLGGSKSPDADLLARFADARDEAAFAELVRRHGGLVFGVCKRVTGNHHLAEDAFQAVFVVLAAKAASLRPRSAVAAWLYGVAFRTSLRARTMADRRRRHEATVDTLPEVGTEPADVCDAVQLLDEAIAALPEALRLPVVLCELEGGSRAEVARQLGIPEGTLSSRLASARKALARRLKNRGVALSAAGLTLALGRVASASVPANLAGRAVAAALAPGGVPGHVAELSSGVLRVMFLNKLKVAIPLVGLLVVALFAGGLFAVEDPPAPPKRAEVPQPAKPLPPVNRILFYRSGFLTTIDPDGKNEKKVSENRAEFHPGDSKLSPDGKTLATLIQTAEAPKNGRDPQRKLYVRAIGEKEPGTDTGVTCQLFAWSPDGAEIAATDFVDAPGKDEPEPVTSVYNLKTKEKSPLKVPAGHIVTDWSRDGKRLVTTAMKVDNNVPHSRIWLVNRDGTEPKAVTDGKGLVAIGRLSPDGKRVLAFVFEVAEETPAEKKVRDEKGMPPPRPKPVLSVIDAATGKATPLADLPLNGDIQGYCWSPDGKQIAYAWRQVHDGDPKELGQKETESFLVVCDADGKNAKTIATEKADGQGVITIAHVDWR